MFGSTRYPFNFCNRNGIPMIESTQVNATSTETVITLPNRVFRWLNDKGIVLFRLNQSIPESSSSLPIVFSSNDFTQPLTNLGGEAITGAQVESTGVYIIYYDKDANLMQLLTSSI